MLLLVGTDDELGGVDDACAIATSWRVVTLPLARARLYVTMKNYLDLVALRARDAERGRTAERYRYELGELISIARAISSERDIGKLLGLILRRARYVTGADAGWVYIVEGQRSIRASARVRFMVSQNDSVEHRLLASTRCPSTTRRSSGGRSSRAQLDQHPRPGAREASTGASICRRATRRARC